MAVWQWPAETPGGEPRVGVGDSEEEAWRNYESSRRIKTIQEGAPLGEPPKTLESDRGAVMDFMLGGVQGLIDPVEGVGQLVEHLTGIKVAPDKIKKGLRDFRTSVQSTRAGQAGELAGNIGGSAIPGMALTRGLRMAGALAPTARLSANAVLPRIFAGGIAGAEQPVEGRPEDYWMTKAAQAGGGALAGVTLPEIAQAAARINVPSHWSWTHFLPSALGHIVQPVGRFFSRTPASTAGAVAGDVIEQTRQPLRITVPVGDKVPPE